MTRNATRYVLEQYVLKGVLAFAGISLGVNSYFVKEKVAEISDSLKALNVAYNELKVDSAVRDQLVNALTVRVEVCENRSQRLEERVREMELKMPR